MVLANNSVDVALTDPPYHDDVQYGELSLPLRAWAQLSTAHRAGEASVNPSRGEEEGEDDYQALLAAIFTEVRADCASRSRVTTAGPRPRKRL
jgi:putative DNA methylase